MFFKTKIIKNKITQKELFSWIMIIGIGFILIIISQIIKKYIQNNYHLVDEPKKIKTFLSTQYLENENFFFNFITVKENVGKYSVIVLVGIILVFLVTIFFFIKNVVNRFLVFMLFSSGLSNWLNKIWNDHAVIDYWVINIAWQFIVINLEDLIIFGAIISLIISNCFFLIKKREKNGRN